MMASTQHAAKGVLLWSSVHLYIGFGFKLTHHAWLEWEFPGSNPQRCGVMCATTGRCSQLCVRLQVDLRYGVHSRSQVQAAAGHMPGRFWPALC